VCTRVGDRAQRNHRADGPSGRHNHAASQLHSSAYSHFDRQPTANSASLDTFFMLAVKFTIREAAIV
jgi:hypothetical protein